MPRLLIAVMSITTPSQGPRLDIPAGFFAFLLIGFGPESLSVQELTPQAEKELERFLYGKDRSRNRYHPPRTSLDSQDGWPAPAPRPSGSGTYAASVTLSRSRCICGICRFERVGSGR